MFLLTDLPRALFSGIPPLVWVVLGILMMVSVLSALFGGRIKGWMGERRVSRGLRLLDGGSYTVFDDLYLPRVGGGEGSATTQVDHVVVRMG